MKIRPARYADVPAVTALLEAAGLPEKDVGAHLATLLVGEQGGVIVAAGAFEPLGEACLLRSVVVAPAFRGRRWGVRMTRQALDFARRTGIREAWLLTTGASAFFATQGFVPVPRETAPELVRRTRQFSALCPASATLMRLQLDSTQVPSRLTATALQE